jgi:hypothetical protein
LIHIIIESLKTKTKIVKTARTNNQFSSEDLDGSRITYSKSLKIIASWMLVTLACNAS